MPYLYPDGPPNIARLLDERREGRMTSESGGVRGGGRGWVRDRLMGGSFARDVNAHPSLVGKLKNTKTLRGHIGEPHAFSPIIFVMHHFPVAPCVCRGDDFWNTVSMLDKTVDCPGRNVKA
ncbi:unnamed protein product [Discosporangium mesarthrocarpum]